MAICKGKIESIFSSEEQFDIIDPSLKEKQLPYHVTKKVLDKTYNNACETNNIIINKIFFVSFTESFKYLGSWISYDLHDTFDIESRIFKTNQAI